jgi:apolipoprotein N-acyltransferase
MASSADPLDLGLASDPTPTAMSGREGAAAGRTPGTSAKRQVPHSPQALTAVLAAIAGGGIVFLGTGLRPIAALTWFALLPVLLVAPRLRRRWTAGAAIGAMVIGQSNLWAYFAGPLEMPPPILVAVLAFFPLLAAGAALLFRSLAMRGRTVAAMLAVPVIWVAGEYLLSIAQPHGAWLSLGYTQADVRPVVQVASVTGVWGITFLVALGQSAIAAFAAPGQRRSRWRAAVVAVAVVAVSSGYWGVRLLVPQSGPTVRVAVLGGPRDAEERPDSDAGRALLTTYTLMIRTQAERGATVVVLPEKVFATDERTWPLLAEPMADLALRERVTIVVGAAMRQDGTAKNVAVAFPAGGDPVTYTKRHLIPGLESELTEGDGPPVVMPGGLGFIICKDLDFPALVREDRRAGASVLLAPAWDMGDDGWLHGRMAVVRGVEDGASVARAGRNGLLTISDPTGDVVAEADAVRDPHAAIVADVRTGTGPTPYARIGDVFAWLCVAAALLLAVRQGAGRAALPR